MGARMGNKLLAAALAATASFAFTGSAVAANLVSNSSFETGDFTGWTQTGNTTFNGVQCPGTGPTVGAGNCSAFFGPVGSPGGISQTLATTAGSAYNISFWFAPDGGTPSSFDVLFDGNSILSLTNPGAAPGAFFNLSGVASGASSVLSFSFRDDPGFMFLDAVSVSEAPEPATWAMMLLGFGAVGVSLRWRRRKDLAVPRAA